MREINPYRDGGVSALVEAGLFAPLGQRVLLRALLYEDFAPSLSIETIGHDSRAALLHEVVAVGPAVPEEYGLRPGMRVMHLSAAVDRVDNAPDCRYGLVHYEDVVGACRPPDDDKPPPSAPAGGQVLGLRIPFLPARADGDDLRGPLQGRPPRREAA